jgi:DNA-binding MarR family transcriptional regulator
MKHLPKKKPVWELPLDAGSNCVGGRVRMLSRVISSIYGEAFAPLDLKLSQFSVLAVLSHQGAVAATDLCRILMMDKSTASRNLQRMRRRGWISVVDRGDGRGQEISLTREGVQFLRTAYPLWRKAQQEATRRLGAKGLAALTTVVERVKG